MVFWGPAGLENANQKLIQLPLTLPRENCHLHLHARSWWLQINQRLLQTRIQAQIASSSGGGFGRSHEKDTALEFGENEPVHWQRGEGAVNSSVFNPNLTFLQFNSCYFQLLLSHHPPPKRCLPVLSLTASFLTMSLLPGHIFQPGKNINEEFPLWRSFNRSD